MGISVFWDNRNRTIIRWVFDPAWEWDQIQTALFETEILIEQLVNSVDFILDMSETDSLPGDDAPDGILSTYLRPIVGSDSMIVIVGCNDHIMNILLDWLQGRDELRANLAFMDTLDDARLILYESDDETYVDPLDLYDIRWIAHDRIILAEFKDDLGIDAIESLNWEIEQMLVSMEGLNVSIIFDATLATKLNARPIQIRSAMTFLNNPCMKWLVVVGASDIIRFATSVVMQLTQHVPIFTDTQEAAFALLDEIGVQ